MRYILLFTTTIQHNMIFTIQYLFTASSSTATSNATTKALLGEFISLIS